MKFFMIACLLALTQVSVLAMSPNAALMRMNMKSGEHPIGKVITMLGELKVQAQTEGEAEAVSYQKFEYWCKNSLKELKTAITTNKETIETLEDQIESKTKLIAKLTQEIADLEKQLAESEAAGVKAADIRKEENKNYEDADKDFTSTVKAIDECIDALSTAKDETKLLAQKSVLKVIRLAKYLVSEEERHVLSSFLQAADPPSKPDAKVYTFKSQKVIELLKGLKEKFEADQLEATKAETNALNAFNLAKDARDQADEAASKSKKEKESIKGTAEEDLAGFEEDLTSTKEDLKSNEGSLESTTDTCSVRATEWATRQETRANEIAAMDMAIKILAKVGGVRTPKELIQVAALSFIQIDDPKAKAVKLLVAEAQKLHSKSLQKLADQIRKHGDGPFDGIIQMIQKMIFRLMAEQKDEDDHKNWCDMELEKSTASKEDKTEKLDALQDKIDQAESQTQKLAGEIEELSKEVSELTTYIQEETDMRNEAKAENAATIKDAKDAQDAISNAVAVLTEFYKSSGMTLLMQKGQHREPVSLPDSPETWDAGYTGVSDPNAQPDGIVTVLEKIGADFAEMESQTASQEATDQEEYDKDMTEKAVEKAGKEKEGEMKGSSRARLLNKLKNWNGEKKHVVSELEAVTQYLKDLEPACVSGDSTYEDRKQARTDEVTALREAQNILEAAFKEKAFMQRKVSVHLQ